MTPSNDTLLFFFLVGILQSVLKDPRITRNEKYSTGEKNELTKMF